MLESPRVMGDSACTLGVSMGRQKRVCMIARLGRKFLKCILCMAKKSNKSQIPIVGAVIYLQAPCCVKTPVRCDLKFTVLVNLVYRFALETGSVTREVLLCNTSGNWGGGLLSTSKIIFVTCDPWAELFERVCLVWR
jgi:hypothetical protein